MPAYFQGNGFWVHFEAVVDKPVGTPDGVQWMTALEWSVDPLSPIALVMVESRVIDATSSHLLSHLRSHFLSASVFQPLTSSPHRIR